MFISFSSHIVIMQEEMIILRELSDRTGYGRVKAKHSINSLFRITAKKKLPDVITFIFHSDNDASTDVKYRFHIPNSRQLTDKLTARLQPTKSSSTNSNS